MTSLARASPDTAFGLMGPAKSGDRRDLSRMASTTNQPAHLRLAWRVNSSTFYFLDFLPTVIR
jgi:hypothetical protein